MAIMRTFLICHQQEMLNRVGLARWLASFSELTGILVLEETTGQKRRRIQIRELHARGHAVGSHSCSHPTRMALCKPAEPKREWTESVRVLAAILDSPVRIASVPGGYYLKSVAHEAAAAGIEVLFNSEPITRPQRVSGCLVVGRFSIRQGVSGRHGCAHRRRRLFQLHRTVPLLECEETRQTARR